MKLEIKNKSLFIKNTAWACVVIFLFLLLLWQLRSNSGLTQELAAKKSEHKEAASAGKRLTLLQRQLQDLEQKEKIINSRVPADEKHPFSLIRTLTAISGEIGLKGLGFSLKTDLETKDSHQPSAFTHEGPKPMKLAMDFEATYRQLLSFLDRLAGLDRIISVEQLNLQRKKEILPYQKVSLQLIIYTF